MSVYFFDVVDERISTDHGQSRFQRLIFGCMAKLERTVLAMPPLVLWNFQELYTVVCWFCMEHRCLFHLLCSIAIKKNFFAHRVQSKKVLSIASG